MKSNHINKSQGGACATETTTINQKPVIMRPNAKTVINLKSSKFAEKFLCDGITLNPGDACVFRCAFCYVGAQMIKVDKPYLDTLNAERRARGESELGFEDVVIRRPDSVGLLRGQLFRNGRPKFTEPDDNRVVYGSTLVDVAATMELLRETAALCNQILENTAWQIRLLSKSSLPARLFKDNLTVDWWAEQRTHGAVLLGKAAERKNLTHVIG
jgi:DNA repair photolyase